MKYVILFMMIFISHFMFAQKEYAKKINQFNDKGQKEGFWKEDLKYQTEETYYHNDTKSGIYKAYRNGKLACLGEFENGEMSSIWYYFGDYGHLIMIQKDFKKNNTPSPAEHLPTHPVTFITTAKTIWAMYAKCGCLRRACRQSTQYYAGGLPCYDADNDSYLQPYKFGGKEFIETHGYDSYDFHARMRMGAIPAFETPDPLAEKRPWESPYCYAGNNPINFIDPDGREVVAADILARRNITNTLSKAEAQYVRFDDNGRLDVSLLNQYDGNSKNFTALHSLANSETSYIFAVASQDINGSKFFEKGSNPKNPNNFSYGVTNMPGMEHDPSPNNNVYIFTASFLDEKTQTRNTAHEGYGHAYFFELSKNNPSINPNHTKGIVGTGVEYDPDLKKNVPYFIFGQTNTALENQIKMVEKQAIKNYEDRNL